jgi:hypothetical protein
MDDDQKAKKQISEVRPALDQKIKGLERSGDLLRRLQAITDTARIVIRATDEVRMLEEVCRIIAEIGDYRLARVGYAEEIIAKAHDGTITVESELGRGSAFLIFSKLWQPNIFTGEGAYEAENSTVLDHCKYQRGHLRACNC